MNTKKIHVFAFLATFMLSLAFTPLVSGTISAIGNYFTPSEKWTPVTMIETVEQSPTKAQIRIGLYGTCLAGMRCLYIEDSYSSTAFPIPLGECVGGVTINGDRIDRSDFMGNRYYMPYGTIDTVSVILMAPELHLNHGNILKGLSAPRASYFPTGFCDDPPAPAKRKHKK